MQKEKKENKAKLGNSVLGPSLQHAASNGCFFFNFKKKIFFGLMAAADTSLAFLCYWFETVG